MDDIAMQETRMMLKQDVLHDWEERAVEAQVTIREEIEPELERRRYELEIARRLLEKAEDDGREASEVAQETWQTQVDVLEMLVGMLEGDLAEQQDELALCEAMIAEIKADLGPDEVGVE
jgi:ribosome maturation protein Sdo1